MWKKFKSWVAMMWRKVRAAALAVLIGLGLITGALYAESITVSWTHPNTRNDGTALALSDLRESRLYCSTNNQQSWALEETIAIPAAFVLHDFPIGVHECAVTAVDTNGRESDFSNIITITVLAARPSPPVLDPPTP